MKVLAYRYHTFYTNSAQFHMPQQGSSRISVSVKFSWHMLRWTLSLTVHRGSAHRTMVVIFCLFFASCLLWLVTFFILTCFLCWSPFYRGDKHSKKKMSKLFCYLWLFYFLCFFKVLSFHNKMKLLFWELFLWVASKSENISWALLLKIIHVILDFPKSILIIGIMYINIYIILIFLKATRILYVSLADNARSLCTWSAFPFIITG